MATTLYHGDIPADLAFGDAVAVDTETMGLNTLRDRLCLVQLSSGDGNAHLVQFAAGEYDAPNLKALLSDANVLKLFHFGRFDLAALQHYLGVDGGPVYCTKIASKLIRTYTDRHGLKNLLDEMLNVDVSKQQQMSNWGAEKLTDAQISYAASDVLYLHALKEKLDARLEREGRSEIAQSCFEFLPTRAQLDLAGWPEIDIFAH